MSERDHLDRCLAAGLEQHLAARIRHDTRPGTARTDTKGTRRRTVWVTAVVGSAVVLLAVFAIRAVAPPATGQRPAYAPPASPTASPTHPGPVLDTAALVERLPKPDYGRILHTWTEEDAASTGPFSTGGDTVVIAGVCNGGGAVSWTDVTGKAHTLSCNGLRVQAPGWRFNLGGDEQPTSTTTSFRISVKVLQGDPRFVIRMWAVDPRILRGGWYVATSSPDVPVALRTCQAGDLAATGRYDALTTQHGGVITVTNRSSTDCAVRSWPTLTYRDSDGDQIGSPASMSLDSTEGELNRYHEFPPARISAGGQGYLIAGLYPLEQLRQDDEQQAAAAAAAASASPAATTPSAPLTSPASAEVPAPQPCDPKPVAALRLVIAGSTITVPVPTEPAAGACARDGSSFGVNPVVTTRPAGE